jgi:hypothetical protein
MTETEAKLRREILRLESEKFELLKKLQRAEELNFQIYTDYKELREKVKEMERLRNWEQSV